MRRGPRRLAGIILVLAAAFLLAAPFGFKPYGIFILSMWAVMTIAAIGLNLTLGYAGRSRWRRRPSWGSAPTSPRC